MREIIIRVDRHIRYIPGHVGRCQFQVCEEIVGRVEPVFCKILFYRLILHPFCDADGIDVQLTVRCDQGGVSGGSEDSD